MKIVRIASLCLAFASVVAVPLTASAGQKPSAAKSETFDAPTYKKAVEQRLEKMKAKIEKRSAKLSHDKRDAIKKEAAVAEKELRAALDKAAADGVITHDEAKTVHAAAKKLRAILKDELPSQHAKKNKPQARR